LATGVPPGTEGFREPTLAEVLAVIRGRIAITPQGSWISATIGANVLGELAANRFTLDEVAPKHRIWLQAWTGHGVVLSSAALRSLGIGEEESDPVGGWYEREPKSGRLNGVLHGSAIDNAVACLLSTVPDDVVIERLQAFAQEALRFGITSIQDMSLLSPARIIKMLERAKLPIRWREVPIPDVAGRCGGARDAGSGSKALPRVSVSGAKYSLDGTPVERLAWMREPYSDRSGFSGRPYLTPEEIAKRVATVQARGEQPLFHVGGDRTAETLLAELSRAPDPTEIHRLRPRVEHGDWMTSDLHSLARVLGVVVVQNPSHFTLPELFASRFGADRMRRVFPLRSLLKARIQVALGSDGLLNPYLNLLFATTLPANPAEALTLEETIVAYTRTSAYAEFAEKEKGMLSPGMLADFAVLSQDIFTVPPDALPATQSVLTVIGGKIAFDGGVL
jgi:predicted amidohydrolase YtcJ